MSSSDNKGLSLGDVLQIVFLILKLCGLINWTWFWVLSPTWISLILAGLILWWYRD